MSVVAAQRAIVSVGACLLLGTTLAACTSGPARTPAPAPTAPTATPDGPSMTTIPDGRGSTVTADDLQRAPQPAGRVSHIEVRNADGLFWDGGLETVDFTRKGRSYRLFGRCLPATTGGTLVVDVLGPAEGAAGSRPTADMSGPVVATLTIPCDGSEASVDLTGLPASSGPLSVSEDTRQVEHGWVVLTRTT